MILINGIKQGFKTLINPDKEFTNINKRSFESILSDYLIMLLAVGLLAAAVSVLFYLGKAFYLDIFKTVDIQYGRMLNYSMGRATSLMFFYLFSGTFLMFILSMILNVFFRKVKYVKLLGIMFYSLTPVLLFSWVHIFAASLLIWSIFLFCIGIKKESKVHIKKDSIQQRD